jgi:cytochrome c oxidase assembly factor CtaG
VGFLRLSKRCAAAAVAMGLSSPAVAHGSGQPSGYLGGFGESWLLVVMAAVAVLYAIGVGRAWSRAGVGRGIKVWQAALFGLGMTILAATQLPPLHGFAESLFTGHMIEHKLIIAFAAPLLVLARPLPAFVFALPARARRSGFPGRLMGARWLAFLTMPAIATGIHAAALWGWHVPAAFALATADPVAHAVQHISFLVTALLFWWAMLERPGRHDGVSAFHLFLTMMHMGALGALIALAPTPAYAAADPGGWGLTPLEDQQFAGIVMWVPAGLVYFASALALFARWIGGVGATEISWRPPAA